MPKQGRLEERLRRGARAENNIPLTLSGYEKRRLIFDRIADVRISTMKLHFEEIAATLRPLVTAAKSDGRGR